MPKKWTEESKHRTVEFMKYPIKKARSRLAHKLAQHLGMNADASERLADVVSATSEVRARIGCSRRTMLDVESTRSGDTVASVLTRVWSQGLIPPLGIFSRESGGELGPVDTDSSGFLRIRVSDMSDVVAFLRKSMEPCWSARHRELECRSSISAYGILSPISATMVRIESPSESVWALMGLHGADRIREVHNLLEIKHPLDFSPETQKRRLKKQRVRMQELDSLVSQHIQYRNINQEIPVRLILKVSGPDAVAGILSYLANSREGTNSHLPVGLKAAGDNDNGD